MEIVIKIDDNLYKSIDGAMNMNFNVIDEIMDCIKRGKKLPKNHGDLIDEKKLSEAYDKCLDFYMALELAPIAVKGE